MSNNDQNNPDNGNNNNESSQKLNDNLNNENNDQNPNYNRPPKKSTWKDIFLGVGLAILIFMAMYSALFLNDIRIISIIEFIIISISTFLSVRFKRRNRPILGTLILVAVIPMTLLLLLVGSCGFMFNGL